MFHIKPNYYDSFEDLLEIINFVENNTIEFIGNTWTHEKKGSKNIINNNNNKLIIKNNYIIINKTKISV
jgi:hypothetical protein